MCVHAFFLGILAKTKLFEREKNTNIFSVLNNPHHRLLQTFSHPKRKLALAQGKKKESQVESKVRISPVASHDTFKT